MKDVDIMTRDELEDEVLALRFKLAELVTRPVDWIDDINMAPQCRRLLKFMEGNMGRVCSNTVLHESMYDIEPPTGPKVVDVRMCQIRKKLAGTGYAIKTHWGYGYSLEDA